MTYIDGFVAAVPQENKQVYVDHAREALSPFKDHHTRQPKAYVLSQIFAARF